ncbi:MAG: PQQ-binding-like beta-propeller repeat protein [Bacteroidetes bacterium]|nr:PQQ-binding-like beta-propeller repeat protein [Bacteroidota bacterium]
MFDKLTGDYKNTVVLQHEPRAMVSKMESLYMIQACKPSDSESVYGRIVSLNAETNQLNWEFETTIGGFYYADLIMEDGVLFSGITSRPSIFVAIGIANGEVKWALQGYWCHRFTIGDGKIFINDSNYILAVDQQIGEILWEDYFQGHTESNLAYLDGYLYHAHNGGLYIWDAQNGNRVTGPIESPDGSDFYNLNAGNGKLFIQSRYYLYAYEAWK